jgi:tetratricopeptide (TPR) repeat protein
VDGDRPGPNALALGRYGEGIARLHEAIAAIGQDGDRRFAVRGVVRPSPQARTTLALCLARIGALDEAVREAEEALRVAEQAGGAMGCAWACYALGRAHHARMDWERAFPLLERAAALCDAEGFVAYQPRVLSGLASAYAQAGRIAEALPLLERALEGARAIGLAYGETLIVSQLGTTCVAAGRIDEAAGHATRALALARRRGERGEEAWALLLTGDVAAHRAPPEVDAARDAYAAALALGGELGMRPLVARTRVGLGALELAAGRREDGHRHLAEAAEDAEAMGIAVLRDRARALLA